MEDILIKSINIDNNICDITIKKRLNFVDALSFVQSVVFTIVNEEDQAISYVLKSFLIKKNTIEYYTNIEIKDNKFDEVFDFIDRNNLYNEVINCDGFDIVEYRRLLKAIDDQIEFESQKIIKKSKIDDLIELLIDFVNKIDTDKISNFINKFDKIKNINEEKIIKAIVNTQNKK